MRFMIFMIPEVYQPGAAETPVARTGVPDAEAVAAMSRFNEELQKAGALVDLNGLQPLSAGARVSFKDGKPLVTDGPFTETKEVVGGYWIIDVASKAEAVAWASRCPAGPGDVLEVRRIMGLSDFPEDVQQAARDNAPELTAARQTH